MEGTWSLQDAKNRFSAVVDAAERGEPQLVTKRGRPAVVIVRADEFAGFEHRRLPTIELSSIISSLFPM